MDRYTIEFRPSGRGKAQCPADPKYPNGIALDCSTAGNKTCEAKLPYPAPECGTWIIRCTDCDMSVGVTVDGRVDDPISVKMDCK